MIGTPWGDSDSLRERKLQPARGTLSEDVKRNQRERLFAAMVASVSQRGFAATTVADLVELSGVSSRSFYDLFGDKAHCLRATAEELLLDVRREMGTAVASETIEEALSSDYRALSDAVIAQPAAAKVCLVDIVAAGPEAVVPVEEAISNYEQRLRELYESSPERAGIPAAVITARVGGVLEILRSRLSRGTEADLPRLGRDILALLLADRPPPAPLRLAARRPKTGSESLEAPSHAERAIRAFATIVAEKGYAETTVEDVVKRASMSSTTFYDNFAGKDDLMAAAIDSICAQAIAAVTPAFARHDDWPDAVRAGFGSLLNFLASRPALGRLVLIETYVAGDAAIQRRARGLAPLSALIENNTSEWMYMQPVIYEAIAGGTLRLLYREAKDSGVESLPSLAPVCTYLTLSPFIGAERACEAANGAGTRRTGGNGNLGTWSPDPLAGAITFREPMKRSVWKVWTVLSEGDATATEIAESLDDDAAVVADFLGQMMSNGVLEEAGERDGEPLFHAPFATSTRKGQKLNLVSTQQMNRMTLAENEELTADIFGLINADIESSRKSGEFESRMDRCLARLPMVLDEIGWRELNDLHEQTLHASFEVQARATKRLADSGEAGFPVRSFQLTFEMPAEADQESPADEMSRED